MRRFLLVGFLWISACSGTASGSSSDGGSSAVPEGGSPLATGTCAFTLDGKAYTLPGYATMNGSGNLRVECAAGDTSLELGAGNATYRGPAEYTFAPQKIDGGDLELTTSDAVYEATWGSDPKTACIVDVTKGVATDDPPAGSDVEGTFHCTAVPRLNKMGVGGHGTDVSGTFDITAGAFAVTVR
jgi:hypothetical protein